MTVYTDRTVIQKHSGRMLMQDTPSVAPAARVSTVVAEPQAQPPTQANGPPAATAAAEPAAAAEITSTTTLVSQTLPAVPAAASVDDKSSEYTEEMQAKMGTSLTYRHEDGINYNFILPDLIVGSCLQGPEDVDRLAQEAGVTTVFSLQVRLGLWQQIISA